jgi:NDP-sugar pyrophosphorylase family protein
MTHNNLNLRSGLADRPLAPGWFFDLSRCPHPELFKRRRHVWDVLKHLENYVRDHARREICGQVSPGASVVGEVYVGEGARIEPGAVILGPAIIGDGCEIRSHAYIRPFVIVGADSIIGHACEIKHAYLFPECEVPHFAYVGDSVLGYRVHLGAGVKTANVKINNEPIQVKMNGRALQTHLEKFGAILGDYVEIGCNTVLNPGTLVGPRTLAVANLSLRGVYPADAFVKSLLPEEVLPRRPQQRSHG